MITTKDSIKQILSNSTDSSDKNAAHLVGSIAEDLNDGDYLLSMIPSTVIFIRTNDWSPDMKIMEIDLEATSTITLSSGRIINLYAPQIKKALEDVDQYRIVLLSNQGYSAFKVDVEKQK